MRKPIQISGYMVLCDDGSIFRLDHSSDKYGNFIEYIWERLPDIPQDDQVKYEKETSKEEVQWQKIETCPRDGSFILLTDGKEVYQGNFSEKGFWKGTNISRTKLGFGLYPNLPTHWMPLPAPPKED